MKKIYNVLISVLAVFSIILAILDLCNVIYITERPFDIIDKSILIFFAIDYFIRFLLSKERRKFFKENIFDLVAIIPFNSLFAAFRIFRFFRVLKLTKLAKVTRVVRAVAFFGVVKQKIDDILKTNGFLYVLYANIITIIISSVVIMLAEKMPFGDSLWWSIVTCTTVGYGDISPQTPIGRITAVILMIFGIGLIGMLTGAITTYFTQQRKKESTSSDLNELIDSLNDEERQKVIEIIKIIKGG